MHRRFWMAAVFATIGPGSALPAGAQAVVAPGYRSDSLGISPVYAAPGNFGTTYGSPSFGSIRTASAFSSPYGVGFGNGYGPATILPGPFGQGLWRPGYGTADGYTYGSSLYNTFAPPYTPGAGLGPLPIGVYAPAFGPPYVPASRYGR